MKHDFLKPFFCMNQAQYPTDLHIFLQKLSTYFIFKKTSNINFCPIFFTYVYNTSLLCIYYILTASEAVCTRSRAQHMLLLKLSMLVYQKAPFDLSGGWPWKSEKMSALTSLYVKHYELCTILQYLCVTEKYISTEQLQKILQ